MAEIYPAVQIPEASAFRTQRGKCQEI